MNRFFEIAQKIGRYALWVTDVLDYAKNKHEQLFVPFSSVDAAGIDNKEIVKNEEE